MNEMKATPYGILNGLPIARDATIQSIVQEWKLGGMSWESALCLMVTTLYEEKTKLLEDLLKLHQRMPASCIADEMATCHKCGKYVLVKDLKSVVNLTSSQVQCSECRK